MPVVVYRNARQGPSPTAPRTALRVAGTRLDWLGPDADVPVPAGARVVDLGGAWVTPAFADAHVHATATGLALTGLDLAGTATLADALDRVTRAARAARGRPLLGAGWDETRWPEGRAPTSAELDRAAYGGAVYLARVDAHSAVISSALAAAVPGLAGLTGYRADGWLRRDAHDAARVAAFAAVPPAAIRDAQRATLAHAAALGIACVHEMAGPAISSADDLAGLLALARTEALPEVIGYWGELFGVEAARDLGAVGAGGDLFLDGSLGSHTAALGSPYADEPGHAGELRFDTADVAEHIARCDAAGLQAGFHAIGDAAVDQVLDALDLLRAADRPVHQRHRVEHAEFVADPARFAAANLTASMQPMFDAAWGGPAGMYAQRLGPQRSGRLNRFADLAAAGVPLAFGSDAPVTPIGPWPAVWAAAHPHRPEAALTPAAAFAAHTVGGWQAAGRGSDGRFVVGAPATFAAWQGGEGWAEPAGDRRVPRCVRTVHRGREIFSADAG